MQLIRSLFFNGKLYPHLRAINIALIVYSFILIVFSLGHDWLVARSIPS
mgnify:CR=1 FL=1